MKKSILLSFVLLLSCLSSDAVCWQKINTGSNDVSVYIDEDSVRQGQNQGEYLYAIRYSVKNSPEKTAYIKSDYNKNLIGIIRTEDYTEDAYRPTLNLSNAHVFMKPVENTPFLEPIHYYTAQEYANTRYANNTNNYVSTDSELPVNYGTNEISLREPAVIDIDDNYYNYNDYTNSNDAIQAYLVKTCNQLTDNWQPPQENLGSTTIVFASIDRKGKILTYNIAQSSGSEAVDKSVVDTLYKSQPYLKLPTDNPNIGSMEFKFVFDNGILEKKVVY